MVLIVLLHEKSFLFEFLAPDEARGEGEKMVQRRDAGSGMVKSRFRLCSEGGSGMVESRFRLCSEGGFG